MAKKKLYAPKKRLQARRHIRAKAARLRSFDLATLIAGITAANRHHEIGFGHAAANEAP